jgi:hypothetical protein
MKARGRWNFAAIGLVCLGGCTGQIGDAPTVGAAPAVTPGATGGPITGLNGQLMDCGQPNAPRAPLRRLTRFEYSNTIRDLLGVETRPADALPGEELGNGFGNDADALGVSRILIDGYRTIAHELASNATKDPASLSVLMGCNPTIDESTCASKFISDFGARAFRHPLDIAETSALVAMFAKGKQLGGTLNSAAQAVLELVFQSPQFLYRVELGEIADASRNLARPSPYEMATRLSYLLWGSLPDQALVDAARENRLATKSEVMTQARRLLADPRSHDVVRFFHGQLLGTNGLDSLIRNADYYPSFKAGMGSLYRQETEQFIDYVVWQDKGDLATLFSAPFSFLNESLANVYGMTGVSGVDFRKVPLDTKQRGGLLTQASILSLTTPGSRTDPVVRGKWVYTRMLCGVVNDPPPNVPQLAEPTPGLSVRDRLAMHRSAAACNSCHMLMDPIGFGFEHYDGMGRWRDTDNGLAVDDSGEIAGTDAQGTFHGATELGRKLAASQDAQRCFAGHWLTFAYGRLETEGDACTRASLEDAFSKSGGRIQDLLLALTQTDAFLYRPLAGQ